MTRHIAPASRVWNQSQDTTSLASLLVPTTKFPLSPSIKRIMKAWVTRPSTTVVADFEYHIALLPTMRHEAVFEIAIANASGDWVIPPVTINHQISSSELCDRLTQGLNLLRDVPRVSKAVSGEDVGILRYQLDRFYGPSATACAPSLTWAEIAELLDKYIQVCVGRILFQFLVLMLQRNMGKLTFFSTGATPTATTIASQQVLKVLVEETYCRENLNGQSDLSHGGKVFGNKWEQTRRASHAS